MRYNDLKIVETKILNELVQNPNLANLDTMDMDQALEFIDTQSQNADDDVKQKVLRYLQKFKSYLTQQPIATNEGIDEAIDMQVADIEKLLQQSGKQPTQTELDYVRHVAKLLLGTGAQLGHTELNKIKRRIEALYAPLANKIVSGSNAFVTKESTDEEEQAAREVKRSELSLTGRAVANTIADMTNGVMERAGRVESITDAEQELLKIERFLDRCLNDPFIDIDSLINSGKGTVESEFKKKGAEFVDMYNQFESILSRTIDKSGAGAWGPAELGLLMLCDPVRKGTKGDIETGTGTQVEVKASKKAASGARLNVEKATKGDLTRQYTQVLQQYFGTEIPGPKGENIPVQHQTPMGQVNFTIKGFNILNSWVDHLNSMKGQWNRNKAVKFLTDAINIPMQNYIGYNEKGINYDKILQSYMSSVVSKDGKFDFQTFQKEYTKLLFALYKSEMLDCILVINPILGTYIVMNDPDEVNGAIDTGLVISGGIDFKDKQSTKSPQIGIGKISI